MNGLVGHSTQWKFLTKSALLGKLSHAYLFQGPERVGKKTCAIRFAQWLTCHDRSQEPCRVCETCLAIEKNTHQDVLFLDSQDGQIRMEDIDRVRSHIHLTSHGQNRKVIIIDHLDTANDIAQQALLKILEELPSHSFCIGISALPGNILSTLYSRFSPLRFSIVSHTEMKDFVQADHAQEIIQRSYGRPGVAYRLMQDTSQIRDIREKEKEIATLFGQDMSARFLYVKEMEKNGDIENILQIWVQYMRALMLSLCEGGRKGQESTRVPSGASVSFLVHAIGAVERTLLFIHRTNVQKRTALESCMIDIARV